MINIHRTAVIYDNVEIGADVYIGPYCVIGAPPEHRDYYGQAGLGVVIEEGARLSGFVTIDSGTIRKTTIGASSAIFQGTHVAHDCIIGRDVTIGGKCSLAGHTQIMDGANVSGHSCSFQRIVIGAYAFIGGHSFITRDVPPGEKWLGHSPRFQGLNDLGLQRAGLTYDKCLEMYGDTYERLVFK